MELVKSNAKSQKWEQINVGNRYKIETLFEQGLRPAQIGATPTPQRDRHTIEREYRLGSVEQKRQNPSSSKDVSEDMCISEWAIVQIQPKCAIKSRHQTKLEA